MPFDWTGYLELAGALADDPDPEHRDACYRSAVSRAYYAAFNVSLEYCGARGCIFRTGKRRGENHALVPQYLASLGLRREARRLRQLRRWRNQADYDSADYNARSQARDALRASGALIKALTN